MIKIFVPSWRRPTTMSTPALLDAVGVEYTVIVRKTEYPAYVAAGTPKKRLLVIGADAGLNVAREAARQTLAMGEWCLQMDDNVLGFIQPTRAFYKKFQEVPLEDGEQMVTRAKWQKIMNVKVHFGDFYYQCVEGTLKQAEKRGAYLCGFSAHDNPAFRFRKFTDVGYVCGKMMLMRNQGLPWNQSTESSGEDYALSAAHLWENGRVLINKWGHPLRKHYQPGGCGPYDERLPAMMRAQAELSQRYGSLFRIKNANAPEKKQGELALRFNSLKQVADWRAGLASEMGVNFCGYDPNLRAKKGKR